MTAETQRFPKSAVIPIAALAVYAVFFVGLAKWLWAREHYQFFPIVLVAAGVLAWFRYAELILDHRPRVTYRVAMYTGVALVLLLAAAFLGSNLIGSVSGIIMIWALVWYFGGKAAAKAMRGPVFLLLLMMPLPMNLDLKLIIGLQKIASAVASRMLDLQYIRHSLSGVAITTAHKSFMVEEACSGIHSLFSCLCAVVFVSVLQRSGIVRILFNALQTVLWVIVANAIRVFLIVYSFSVWGVSLTSGWKHEALGVGTYVTALVLALSTDKLFHFLVPIRKQATEMAAVTESPAQRLNNLLDRVVLTNARSMVVVSAVLTLIFLPLSFVEYGRVFGRMVAAPTNVEPINLNLAGGVAGNLESDTALPKQFGNWALTKAEQIDRSPGDPLGMNSAVFMYTGGGLTAEFSVDGYYPAWHDLAYCYVSMGWNVQSQINEVDAATSNHQTQLSIYTNDGQHGLILFSCFDSNVVTVIPEEATIGQIPSLGVLMERLGAEDIREQPMVPPVFQLQLLCIDNRELMDHEKLALRELFEELSRATLKTMEVSK